MTRPLVAVSCGDPAGIGPEIAVSAFDVVRQELDMLWVGDPRHLPAGTRFEVLDTPFNARKVPTGALPVWPIEFASPAHSGQPDLANAAGVIHAIETAVGLVRDGIADALCTAPVHKKVLKDGAGFAFPGHTEFLAHLGGVSTVVMMLASAQLRVVPATIHIALSDVPEQLTPQLLRDTITLTHDGLRARFGITSPRIAVAGLNPHAGEGGEMGREELDWIADLVRDMAREGYAISGPRSADTMFHAAARETYDAAVCMYHDQALIPIKTLDFDRGVNVTLGLPFVRTSPDHGTAFDIAGKGIANPTSMIEALRMAAQMVRP